MFTFKHHSFLKNGRGSDVLLHHQGYIYMTRRNVMLTSLQYVGLCLWEKEIELCQQDCFQIHGTKDLRLGNGSY